MFAYAYHYFFKYNPLSSHAPIGDRCVFDASRCTGLVTDLISPTYTACLDTKCPMLFVDIQAVQLVNFNKKYALYFIPKSNKKIFLSPSLQRIEISQFTLNRSGIYCTAVARINNINGCFYVGSAQKLNNRINDYFLAKGAKSLFIKKKIFNYC